MTTWEHIRTIMRSISSVVHDLEHEKQEEVLLVLISLLEFLQGKKANTYAQQLEAVEKQLQKIFSQQGLVRTPGANKQKVLISKQLVHTHNVHTEQV